ncbi:hypothetical protein [Burkholderia pseudomallei]|uniref:hypothetical protein n=1 Tax=Burkholderia pseudomallei TaxID=28450 RepID=UPI000538936E|nr:hypothetical protein [Burkholderia pseudomallei]KGV13385.1 hypothetical protein X881_3139 [Burkholderia pseudomallei MSHR4300]KGV82178.1 hypothetical protein X887_1166 [Burkholderia pseudomallei MSHR4375]
MPDKLDELDYIEFETASLPKTGKAGEKMYDEEVREYEQASANDPDPLFDKKVRLAFHQRELKQIDDLITARTEYAQKIYRLVVRWLVGIAILLLLQGFHLGSFSLPEKVLLALIGGTTLNVIGIFTIVANFLFSKGASTLMMKMKSLRRASKEVSAKAPATRTRKPKAAPSDSKPPEPSTPPAANAGTMSDDRETA